LPSGEMLTIAGGDTMKATNRIPEVWTSGNTWRSLTTAQANLPYYPMLFSAPNGTVFVAGPNKATGFLNTNGQGNRLPQHQRYRDLDRGAVQCLRRS
jgi:galactose oxidase